MELFLIEYSEQIYVGAIWLLKLVKIITDAENITNT